MNPNLRLLSTETLDGVLTRARDLLREVGVNVEDPELASLLQDRGAAARDDGRIRLPDDLVDRCLASAPRKITLYDRAGNEAAELGGSRCQFIPGSSALRIHDPESDAPRDPGRPDLDRLARLVDHIDVYPVQSTSMVPADVHQDVADRVRLFHALVGCRKPVITGTFREDGLEPMVRMLEAVRGGSEALAEKPLAVFDCCPTPPLTWPRLTASAMAGCARRGIPTTIVSMPLCGATGPVTLHGSLVQLAAENLSGIVLSQSVSEGAPIIWGGCPTAFDMRHGTTPVGAPETVLLNAASMEVARSLGMPRHGYLALSDARRPDMQAGAESALGAVAAVMSAVNLAAGAGLLHFVGCMSLEKLLYDAEICASAHRFNRGIDPHEEEDLPALFETAIAGKGFLSMPHTRKHHRSELTMPGPLVDRKGDPVPGPSMEARCSAELERILALPDENPLPPEVQTELDAILQAEL